MKLGGSESASDVSRGTDIRESEGRTLRVSRGTRSRFRSLEFVSVSVSLECLDSRPTDADALPHAFHT